MQHRIIYREPATYASFPHICGDGTGGQWAVFRQAGAATARAAETGTHTHQDLDSRIMLAHRDSPDSDWSPARTIWESANDGLAVNDPSITLLADGALLLRYARWKLVASDRRHELDGPVMRHYPRTGQVGQTAGNGFLLSTDGGAGWTPLAGAMEDAAMARACSRSPVSETADGAWLLPVYGGYPEQVENAWIIRSWDRGASWGDASLLAGKPWLNLPYREGVSHNETSIAALDETTFVAAIRADAGFVTEDDVFVSEGGVGELFWSISNDAGFTWEKPRPTGLYGQPSDISLLPGGKLLFTYGHRRPAYGVHAAICRLDGTALVIEKTIVLRDDADNWDCGYPASTVNADGSVTSIYYLHCGGDSLRHVVATDWHPDEAEPVA
jgi:hypothetical protein